MNVREWLDEPKKHHTAAALCRVTGIAPPAMSKKVNYKVPFSLEDALLLDKATDGEIRAEEVCPAFAEQIAHLRGVAA